MATVIYPHITVGADGIARVEGSGVKVVMVIEIHLAVGCAAEIQKQLPQLNLAQIYSVLAFYQDNRAEIDAHIERRRRALEEMEQKFGNSPLAQRLHDLKKQAQVTEP